MSLEWMDQPCLSVHRPKAPGLFHFSALVHHAVLNVVVQLHLQDLAFKWGCWSGRQFRTCFSEGPPCGLHTVARFAFPLAVHRDLDCPLTPSTCCVDAGTPPACRAGGGAHTPCWRRSLPCKPLPVACTLNATPPPPGRLPAGPPDQAGPALQGVRALGSVPRVPQHPADARPAPR